MYTLQAGADVDGRRMGTSTDYYAFLWVCPCFFKIAGMWTWVHPT